MTLAPAERTVFHVAGPVCPVCHSTHEGGATCPGYLGKRANQDAEAKTTDGESLIVEAVSVRRAPETMLGAFRFIQEIGAGGMGHVYRARDTALERDVAIKLISGEFLLGNKQAVERFLAEARLTARIRHRNIVQVHGLGTDAAGTPYLVMELLEGKTLKQAFVAKEAFPLARIVRIGTQILSALVAAHEHVIHRDLKPGNIFLTPDGEGGDAVTILDFGVAKAVKDAALDLTGQQKLVLGTIGYSSPEMLLGTVVRDDPRQDLYSVGVLLFQMAARKGPWTQAELDVLHNLLRSGRKPRRLRDVAPDVDPAFADVVDKALQVDPKDRWQSAGEFLGALRSFGVFAPGVLINDTYRIERRLGGGGTSAVYLASDIRMERACAVKALLIGESDDPNGKTRERFRRDGALAKDVKHPNVVEVYAQGVWRERPYIVSEYIEGQTLRDFIRRCSWTSFLAVIRQVASALDAVHEAGIVHRDVTPENILVTTSGAAKLVDFGIARRATSELTGTNIGLVLGRLGYTAPEQAAEPTEATAASDLWSLAAIVYEALTGFSPFRDLEDEKEASPVESYMSRLLNDATPADPRSANSSVDPATSAVVLRALSKDVTARFPSAVAFADALGHGDSTGVRLKGTGVEDSRAPAPAASNAIAVHAFDAPGPVRSIPRWAVGVAVVALLGAGGAIALRSAWRPAGSEVHPPRTPAGEAAIPSVPMEATSADAGVRAEMLKTPDAAAAVEEQASVPRGVSEPPATPAPSKRVPARKSHHPADAPPKPPKKPDPATDKDGVIRI